LIIASLLVFVVRFDRAPSALRHARENGHPVTTNMEAPHRNVPIASFSDDWIIRLRG
jgi:hypothetical protein